VKLSNPGVTRPGWPSSGPVDVLLVCSPGGHLLQLLALHEAWEGYSHAWVTLDKSDARSLLRDERVFYGYGPTIRNASNLLRNLRLAWRIVRTTKPAVILTTGAALAVPFGWIGKVNGAKIVYVESFTRIEKASLSCRLMKPVVDRMYVQWPELLARLPAARYAGNVFSIR
jgi:beta-1,4-N-acetylglucosaminyltransferase